MAEAFNEHFTNIAQVLAQEVPAAAVDPEFYLSYTDKEFCLKTPTLDVVFNLLRKIDEKKATGLDMIPSKLLKWLLVLLLPRLPPYLQSQFSQGSIQQNGKWPG